MLNRRDWLISSAALAQLSSQNARAQGTPQTSASASKTIAIASSNGERACARAVQLLKSGADTLEAAIAGVNINEDDPEDNTVGYGGLPNEEGVVELDSCVMHGPSRRCGSVASIRNIKNPSKVAKLVMEQTDHIMLVGEGALRFAKACGFPEDNLLTEKSRLAWLVWKQSLRDPDGHNNWGVGLDAPPGTALKPPAKPGAALQKMFPHADEATLAWAMEMAVRPPTGTINCLTLNARGEMSGVTTTSGLAWKIPGRVGDSPIIGAGLYLDQDVGGAGSTGRGEENIRVAGAHTIVENMRHGMTPREACLDVLKRVARNFDNDRARLQKISLRFYALRKDGTFAGGSLWKGKTTPTFAVNDGSGASRQEPAVWLLE